VLYVTSSAANEARSIVLCVQPAVSNLVFRAGAAPCLTLKVAHSRLKPPPHEKILFCLCERFSQIRLAAGSTARGMTCRLHRRRNSDTVQPFRVHAAMAPSPRRLQLQNPPRCQGYCNPTTSAAAGAFPETRQSACWSAGLHPTSIFCNKQPNFCSIRWNNFHTNVSACCASPGGPVATTDADSGQEPSAHSASSSQTDGTSKARSTAVLFTDIKRIGCQVRFSFYERTSASCTECSLKM
jgi:hypothetical protein